MARGDETSDREKNLEIRVAALESLLIRLLAMNPEFVSEFFRGGPRSAAEFFKEALPRSAGRSAYQPNTVVANLQHRLSTLGDDFEKLTRSLIEERERTDYRIAQIEGQLEGIRERERAYIDTLLLLSTEDTFAHVQMNRLMLVSVYIESGHPIRIFQLSEAVRDLISDMGFSILSDLGAENGSWFSRLLGRSDDPITRDEVYERLSKVERALELKGIEVPQSEADLNRANAAKAILEAFRDEEEAAAVLGSLCVLKKDGKAVVISLSQEQVLAIRKDPELLRNPSGLQELIFGSGPEPRMQPETSTEPKLPKSPKKSQKDKDWKV
ncbi:MULTISPECIES: hypothetical protein [unclassified Bradyrhizobium]|uniref:hypothetical protein n=1 Tax=unclassified Bradyrhizobium TaxID=2631580 RepID=UPI00291601D8|nr:MULTISPECIES: hypothetical protein [unclassified Bradyrhizobium]